MLRAGGTARVLGFTTKAPSTLGTFLRSFRWGHVRQLDRVSRELLARVWKAGAGPGDAPFTIDLDSTICETYGLAKEGARHHGYTGARGYHPLLAVAVCRRMDVRFSIAIRRHAEIENAIRDLKYGVGLNHLPSGRFAANGAWLAVQVMAHNLARWTARIGLGQQIVTTRDQPKSGLDKLEMIRMLKIVKDSAIKARTQAINQMKALIVTAPSELRPDLGRPLPHYPPGWAVPLLTKHDHPVLRG